MNLRNVVLLNLAVLIIATSAVLARYMSMDPRFMTWARCVIGSMTLALYFTISDFKKMRLATKNKSIGITGVLLGVHWVLFFYSIQLAGVAVAAISVFTYPIFMALLEPWLRGTKLIKRHLIMSAIILVGMYFISPQFSLESSTFIGVLCGMSSALAYAIRNIISKDLLEEYNSQQLMFFQLVIVSLLLLPFCRLESISTIQANIFPLLLLGILPTVIGHALLVHCFRYFTSSQAGVLTGAQPIYSIVLAILFLGEYPTEETVIGGTIIIAAILSEMSIKHLQAH